MPLGEGVSLGLDLPPAANRLECGDLPFQQSTHNNGDHMQVDDEQAIIQETIAFAEAWSEGDAQAAASFFTEDGVRVGAFGDVQHGRAELETAYDKLLHQTMPGAKAVQGRGTVHMLCEGIALRQGGLEIASPSGAVMKGHVVQVMKKVGQRWLILEAHPKFFPPRPEG